MSGQTVAIETQLPQDIYLTLQAGDLFREGLALIVAVSGQIRVGT